MPGTKVHWMDLSPVLNHILQPFWEEQPAGGHHLHNWCSRTAAGRNGSSPARSHVAGLSLCRCSRWDFPGTPSQVSPCSWKRRWHRAVERKRDPWEGASGRPRGFCSVVEQDNYFTSALIFRLLLYQMVKQRLLPGLLICRSQITGTHCQSFPASHTAVKQHPFSQINLVPVNQPLAWPELTTHFQGVYVFIPRHLTNSFLAGCGLLQGGCSSNRVGQMMNHHSSDVHLHSSDLITSGWVSICSSYIMANARDINSLLPHSY